MTSHISTLTQTQTTYGDNERITRHS